MRVVRFYVSASPSPPPSPSPPCPSLPRLVFATTIICAQRSATTGPQSRSAIRPVFGTGPQLHSSAPSVRYRNPTAIICPQCSLPDPNRDHPCPVFATGPQPRASAPGVCYRSPTAIVRAQCLLPEECQTECQEICQKECQKICQKECQKIFQKYY